MNKLQLIDMTLRQFQSDESRKLTFKQKLEIARNLDRLRVDAIELPPISSSKADQLTNRTISSMVSARISAAVDISAPNVDETWESIRSAKSASLNIIAPLSTVLMEYSCHLKAPAMLDKITALSAFLSPKPVRQRIVCSCCPPSKSSNSQLS